MKKTALLVLLIAAIGCQKKHDAPPPPPDTANVSGTWSGPFTYTYPVSGGPVTSVTVNANLSVTLRQDGLGVSGTYVTSLGDTGTVSGNVQNHTYQGALAFVPDGLTTGMYVILGQGMKLLVTNAGITGHAELTQTSASSTIGIGGF